jgi:hypothetical protein
MQTVYKNRSLPSYSATLPAFESKKRSVMLSVAKSTVAAAKADLESQKQQLAAFEENRITQSTSIGQLKARFPHLAKEIEQEIKTHEWAKDSM